MQRAMSFLQNKWHKGRWYTWQWDLERGGLAAVSIWTASRMQISLKSWIGCLWMVSITLKFCTFFTLKKCTDITVFSLRVIHLFPLVDNFHQQSLLLWNDEGFYQVLPLIWYYLGICPAILRSFCLL